MSPSSPRTLLVCALLALAPLACGRSAEPAVPCPAPAADCATLLQQQATIEAAYAGALPVGDDDDGDATVRREAGECAVQLVQASLALGCVDRCLELCRLHPCPVLDERGAADVGGDCAARCGAVTAASPGVDIDTAISRAAEEPGLCTCRGCGAADDALCTALFDCAP